jgi:hypothetical protein
MFAVTPANRTEPSMVCAATVLEAVAPTVIRGVSTERESGWCSWYCQQQKERLALDIEAVCARTSATSRILDVGCNPTISVWRFDTSWLPG